MTQTSPATPRTMRAAVVETLGGPIRVREIPTPEPRTDEVLVRVRWSEVNHVDRFVLSGAYETPLPLPFTIGRDLVGEVEGASGSAHGFRHGDAVWSSSLGYDGRQGAFSEFAVVPADRLYRVPDGTDPQALAAVVHTASTAALGLFTHANLKRGETVFVGGGAGGVGSGAVQFARAAGARVIVSCRPADGEWCRSLGAEAVLDYRDPELADRIATAAPNGIDVWWDQSGHHDLEQTVPLLAPGGRVLLTAGLEARPVLPVGALYTRDASLLGFAISNASVHDLREAAGHINAAFTGSAMRSRVDSTVPLSDAAAAHARMRDGLAHGRILVDVAS